MSHREHRDAGRHQSDGLSQHQRYLNDLYQITSDTTLSFEEKVEQLLTVGCDYFDVGIGMLTHERKDCFEIEQMVGSHPVIGEGTLTPPMTDNYCRHVVESGETTCVHDAGDAGWEDDALYHEFDLQCYAGVKVTARNETYGTFAFSDLSPRDRAFTSADQTFLELMGQCVNYELERKQRVDYLTALNALSRELMGVKTTADVSERVVEAASTTLDLPVTAIALYDDRDRLQSVARTDAAEEVLDGNSLFGGEDGACWEAYVDGASRRVSGSLDGLDAAAHPSVSELAVFPLGDHGVFVTGSSASDGFRSSDFDFVETVAANTKAALDRAERERALERQNSRLESFASMLAHELRNPLSIAQIYHRQAVEGDGDAAAEVTAALDRIEEMIDVLLVTARKGESVIDWEDVSLAEAAADAWSDASTESADLLVETDRTVRSDPVHLHHMLENLFQNSVEHSETTVTVRIGDLPGGFYVEDDGPGIATDESETVFEAGHTTETNGFGLGLTFVKQLADVYGWDCTLTESESGGARFEFTDVDVSSSAE
ncbi:MULTISPECIES: sensor histidine kinase [Halorussus]|uniref:sensor histidine kinase n=1 Tax=Halorussus TaxID=1070314 RepID=UPI0020A1CA31|nr:GAF domain-containing sensor histidine kinase [Halorussus vallis]USZ76845.1 GAF domain-containing sensor histidine kinase [Halorussus vallis]